MFVQPELTMEMPAEMVKPERQRLIDDGSYQSIIFYLFLLPTLLKRATTVTLQVCTFMVSVYSVISFGIRSFSGDFFIIILSVIEVAGDFYMNHLILSMINFCINLPVLTVIEILENFNINPLVRTVIEVMENFYINLMALPLRD